MADQSAPTNIDEALLLLQAERIVLRKDREGQVGSQKTKYADLVQANEVILAKLQALGVVWKTKPTIQLLAGPNGQQDPRFVLQYELLHVASGTTEEGIYPLPAGANPMQNGSAITYARRYALLAITNAVADDDDDDGGGYRGRQGMAQRANVRQEQTRPTAQRATGPATRPKTSRPAERPALPAPRTQAAGEPVRGRGGLITEAMAQKLAIIMKEVIGDNPADRKQFIVDMIGREVASSKELTFEEGRGLIDAFEKAKTTDNPIVNVIDIYRRTSGGDTMPNGRPIPGDRPYEGVPDDHPDPGSDLAPELVAAIKVGDWRTVRLYANDRGGYGPNIDAARGALAAGAGVQERPESSGRAAGQRSRNAREAVTNGGDEGSEPAPWDGELPG